MEKRKYKIVVSDPWSFQNKNGENTIKGEIIDVISPNTVVFQSDELLEFDGRMGCILILRSRYKDCILDLNKRDKYIGAVGGGLYLLNEYKGKSESFLEENSYYILIGTLYEI